MQAQEIYTRSTTLSSACFKVSTIIQTGSPIANYGRGELVRHASDLAIHSKGLLTGQLSSVFVDRLNRCVDSCNGCSFWLQQVLNEKLMDESIILPLIAECDQLGLLFMAALKSANKKID